MGKITVPQELKDQIIDLYQKGMARKDIKKTLNLSFGDSVILSLLQEENIEIRSNPGAQKGGRKKQEVDEQLIEKIIDLYVNKGYGQIKIVHELKLPFSSDKVKAILRERGIHIRNNQEAYALMEKPDLRKYSIDDNYNFESHNGAWLLGFLASDGYLPIGRGKNTRITIGLSAIDKEILECIKAELKYEGPIYEYYQWLNDKQFPMCSLSFTSKPLRKTIESYGIVNNKTFKIKSLPEKLSDEYMLDYIRGYIDGDGSIGTKNGMVISLVSANIEFLKDLDNYLYEKLNLQHHGHIGPDRNIWCIKWRKQDSQTIGKALYDNNYLALQRKKDKYYSLRE